MPPSWTINLTLLFALHGIYGINSVLIETSREAEHRFVHGGRLDHTLTMACFADVNNKKSHTTLLVNKVHGGDGASLIIAVSFVNPAESAA